MMTLAVAMSGEMSGTSMAAIAEVDAMEAFTYSLNAVAMESLFDVEHYENPNSIQEAFDRPAPEGGMWYDAAVEEVEYMITSVVRAVNRRDYKNAHVLKMGWNCVAKFNADGSLKKVRPRAFPKGCGQIAGLEYDPWKISSHTARKESIMTLLMLLVKYNWHVSLYDIRKAFFSSAIKETILSDVPPAFTNDPRYAPYGPKDSAWLYLTNAYGLKQASHDFGEEYASEFVSQGWTRLISDVSVFVKRAGKLICMFSLWVDDNFVIYNVPEAGKMFEELLQNSKYEYTTEPFDYALGMNLNYDYAGEKLTMSHRNFCSRFFKMNNLLKVPVKSIPVPVGTVVSKKDCPAVFRQDNAMYTRFRKILGGMHHVATWTHKEMAYSVGLISKVMANPGPAHMDLLLHMVGYLRGVADRPMIFRRNARLFPSSKVSLWGYCDANYAGCIDTRRSTTGYAIFGDGMLLGSGSRLQPSVALATAEAEFMALTMIITSIVWFSSLLMELGIEVELPILIFCDNKSAICIAKTATVNFKYSKHIDVRQMYCREIINRDGGGFIDVIYCKSEGNISDIMTKQLPRTKFVELRDFLLGNVMPIISKKDEWMSSLHEIFENNDKFD
jgi:hypothetical protein